MAKSYTDDAVGNVTADGIHTYGYDHRGRLVSVDSGSIAYEHNGQGQRVKKDDGSSVSLFVYNEEGNLIGEYDGSGSPIQEHVWLNGAPVAVLVGSNKYYVHTDHLGTPRVVTNSNTPIWRWESGPFGEEAAQEDPDGDTTEFVYNLRFPGQYYDDETGLHYNYFRTYDPSTGRYLESDPIGIIGGLNTFGYVGGNPLGYYDPYGLLSLDEVYGAVYNATDGWSPSQGAVDFWAGFGDGVSTVATLGFYSTADFREDWNIDGGVDECSQTYRRSKKAGYGWGAATGVGVAGRALRVEVNFLSD